MKKNKIALVTGGTRGIGKAISIKFLKEGYNVLVNYHKNDDSAAEFIEEIKDYSNQCILYKSDTSKIEDAKNMFVKLEKEYGRIDVLVNNAGIRDNQLFLFSNFENWWYVLSNNLGGVVNCTKLALPFMLKQRSGTIINITSVSGIIGMVGQSAYSASKAAITSFSKSIAKEIAGKGITINCIAPGLTATDMLKDVKESLIQKKIESIPLKRMCEPTEVAALVYFLSEGEIDYLYGQEIRIDGGLT